MADTPPNEGARLLAEVMSHRDLTQGQVEDAVGAGPAMVVHWLRNPQRTPSTRYRLKLLQRFGIPLEAWDQKAPAPSNDATRQTGTG